MSNLTYLLQALNQPLLIEPTFGAKLVNLFGRKLFRGESFDGERIHAELGVATPGRQAKAPARIAVVPVVGVIAQRAQSLGASTDQIGMMIEQAVRSPDVDAILLDVDSPGGTVPGTPELAEKIRQAAAVKPMLALANSLAASAGYWIAASAGEVWVTPSGESGSIGVWTAHEDWTKFFENEGITVTEFTAGRFKTEGAYWKPLTDEGKAFLQSRVNEVYGWFVKSVAQDRKVAQSAVRQGFGEGRVLGAQQSVDAGLVDRIGTFEQAVEKLAKTVERRSHGPRSEVLKEQFALDTAAPLT